MPLLRSAERKVNWSTARLMTDGVQPALRGFAARSARAEHELDLLRQGPCWYQVEASMELTLALKRGPANLQQVVKRAVMLRGGVGNQGAPAPRRLRRGNHDVSGAGVDQAGGSCGAIEHRPFSSQARRFYLPGGEVNRFISSGTGLNCFHVHLEA